MYSSSYLCLQVISRLENHIILWLQLDWTTSRLLSFCCFIYIFFPTFSSLSSWSEPSGSSTVTRMAAFPWQNSSTLCTSSPETDQTKNSFSSSKCTIWMVSWNSIFTPFHWYLRWCGQRKSFDINLRAKNIPLNHEKAEGQIELKFRFILTKFIRTLKV